MHDRTRGTIRPTGIERPWFEDSIIVTKTDSKGIITSVNEVFLEMSHLTEEQALGKPHNIIRHPDMPRCIFQLMWETLAAKEEIFAYVKNMATNGDHYWVFANVTPDLDTNGEIISYHSKRLQPRPDKIAKIIPLYQKLLEEELKHDSPKDGIAASSKLLHDTLKERGMSYHQFIFSL